MPFLKAEETERKFLVTAVEIRMKDENGVAIPEMNGFVDLHIDADKSNFAEKIAELEQRLREGRYRGQDIEVMAGKLAPKDKGGEFTGIRILKGFNTVMILQALLGNEFLLSEGAALCITVQENFTKKPSLINLNLAQDVAIADGLPVRRKKTAIDPESVRESQDPEAGIGC